MTKSSRVSIAPLLILLVLLALAVPLPVRTHGLELLPLGTPMGGPVPLDAAQRAAEAAKARQPTYIISESDIPAKPSIWSRFTSTASRLWSSVGGGGEKAAETAVRAVASSPSSKLNVLGWAVTGSVTIGEAAKTYEVYKQNQLQAQEFCERFGSAPAYSFPGDCVGYVTDRLKEGDSIYAISTMSLQRAAQERPPASAPAPASAATPAPAALATAPVAQAGPETAQVSSGDRYWYDPEEKLVYQNNKIIRRNVQTDEAALKIMSDVSGHKYSSFYTPTGAVAPASSATAGSDNRMFKTYDAFTGVCKADGIATDRCDDLFAGSNRTYKTQTEFFDYCVSKDISDRRCNDLWNASKYGLPAPALESGSATVPATSLVSQTSGSSVTPLGEACQGTLDECIAEWRSRGGTLPSTQSSNNRTPSAGSAPNAINPAPTQTDSAPATPGNGDIYNNGQWVGNSGKDLPPTYVYSWMPEWVTKNVLQVRDKDILDKIYPPKPTTPATQPTPASAQSTAGSSDTGTLPESAVAKGADDYVGTFQTKPAECDFVAGIWNSIFNNVDACNKEKETDSAYTTRNRDGFVITERPGYPGVWDYASPEESPKLRPPAAPAVSGQGRMLADFDTGTRYDGINEVGLQYADYRSDSGNNGAVFPIGKPVPCKFNSTGYGCIKDENTEKYLTDTRVMFTSNNSDTGYTSDNTFIALCHEGVQGYEQYCTASQFGSNNFRVGVSNLDAYGQPINTNFQYVGSDSNNVRDAAYYPDYGSEFTGFGEVDTGAAERAILEQGGTDDKYIYTKPTREFSGAVPASDELAGQSLVASAFGAFLAPRK